MGKTGKASIIFDKDIYIVEKASVVGQKEGEGPLGKDFDNIVNDPFVGKNTWEEAESELQKLAAEKQKMERQRDFYSRVHEFEQENRSQSSNVVKGEMFFMGVGNEKSLRKRYKDLIKIYHPDNLNGDTGTIQEINREYQVLMQKLEVKYQ